MAAENKPKLSSKLIDEVNKLQATYNEANGRSDRLSKEAREAEQAYCAASVELHTALANVEQEFKSMFPAYKTKDERLAAAIGSLTTVVYKCVCCNQSFGSVSDSVGKVTCPFCSTEFTITTENANG